jgi:hypothetical protein
MITQTHQLIGNDAFGNLWIKYVKLTGDLVNKAMECMNGMNLFSNINRIFCNVLRLLVTTKYLNKKKPTMLEGMGFGNKEKFESYNRWKNTIIVANETSPHLFKLVMELK